MRTAALAFLAVLVPLQAWAQSVELTLNCQYESATDVTKDPPKSSSSSGSFSAIVRMQTEGTVTVEATTVLCFNYAGTFGELQVYANCERTVGSTTYYATLAIDRVSGAFDHTLIYRDTHKMFSGRCTPGKKLF